ncbi:M23 family metallopeptidase [Salinisphaera sp. SPP-AMP-43]|uniref:M23 family metallopeptidase n=1 Tax=Salinisphaera sp. SPP-AMP-43 TaxID=3121288 RepID=UPI003C6E0AFC
MTSSAPASNPRSRSHRRRTVLLALLLASLVVLLVVRADLRHPATRIVGQVVHGTLFDLAGLSPRRVYAWRLWIAGLYDAPLGRRWRQAPERAVPDSFEHRIQARLDFAADRIDARVFTTTLAHGNALSWRLDRRETPEAGCLYATLERRTDNGWAHVASLATDGQPHRYVVETDGRFRVVLQPELAAPVRGGIALARGGSLPFPVVDGHGYDIGGGFGVARDGGARQHKGVDIFADRGTPVRAVAEGRVTTGNGGLGGHYIFLSSGFTRPRFYYAHLDHFAVDNGAHVAQGDVIGYVGNSGNAQGGPTHLHFGIYTGGGAIDPAPFIQARPSLPERPNRG